MSSEDLEAIARRFVEEVQTAHKIEVMDELIGNDFVDHTAGIGADSSRSIGRRERTGPRSR